MLDRQARKINDTFQRVVIVEEYFIRAKSNTEEGKSMAFNHCYVFVLGYHSILMVSYCWLENSSDFSYLGESHCLQSHVHSVENSNVTKQIIHLLSWLGIVDKCIWRSNIHVKLKFSILQSWRNWPQKGLALSLAR